MINNKTVSTDNKVLKRACLADINTAFLLVLVGSGGEDPGSLNPPLIMSKLSEIIKIQTFSKHGG